MGVAKDMTAAGIKRRILDNVFATRLQRMEIDRAEYGRLCDALRELTVHWRDRSLVDREVAGALGAIVATARSMIPVFGRANPALRDEAEDMGFTLGVLVSECFSKTEEREP